MEVSFTSADTNQALKVLQDYIVKEFDGVKNRVTHELRRLAPWTVIDDSGNSISIDDEDEMNPPTTKSFFNEQFKINKLFLERLTRIQQNFDKEYFSFNKASILLSFHTSTSELISEYEDLQRRFAKLEKTIILSQTEKQKQLSAPPQIQVVGSTPLTSSIDDKLFVDVESDDESDDSDDSRPELVHDIYQESAHTEEDVSPCSIITSSTVVTAIGWFSPDNTPTLNTPTFNVFPQKTTKNQSSIDSDDPCITEYEILTASSISDTNVYNNNTNPMSATVKLNTPVTDGSRITTDSLIDSNFIVVELLHIIVDQCLQQTEMYNSFYSTSSNKSTE